MRPVLTDTEIDQHAREIVASDGTDADLRSRLLDLASQSSVVTDQVRRVQSLLSPRSRAALRSEPAVNDLVTNLVVRNVCGGANTDPALDLGRIRRGDSFTGWLRQSIRGSTRFLLAQVSAQSAKAEREQPVDSDLLAELLDFAAAKAPVPADHDLDAAESAWDSVGRFLRGSDKLLFQARLVGQALDLPVLQRPSFASTEAREGFVRWLVGANPGRELDRVLAGGEADPVVLDMVGHLNREQVALLACADGRAVSILMQAAATSRPVPRRSTVDAMVSAMTGRFGGRPRRFRWLVEAWATAYAELDSSEYREGTGPQRKDPRLQAEHRAAFAAVAQSAIDDRLLTPGFTVDRVDSMLTSLFERLDSVPRVPRGSRAKASGE